MRLLFVLALLLPVSASAANIDFTRFLFKPGQQSATLPYQDEFPAESGAARLVIESPVDLRQVNVVLNGAPVAWPSGLAPAGATEVEIPVVLQLSNSIELRAQNTNLTVRVRQTADVELNVISRVHFNTNVSNFVAAREFYGKLGFSTLTGFPDTNTQAMARAIGIATPTAYDGSEGGEAGGYKLHGELIGLGFMSGSIDLIEFSIPRDESAPYAALNHLGMSHAAFLTTDLDADYAYMKSIGVVMLSPPVARANGERFLIFKDLDGTFYELREQAGDVDETETTHITGFGPLNINVSDLERSRAWYQMMGHDLDTSTVARPSQDVATAMGLQGSIELKSALASLPGDGSTIALVQWLKPFDAQRAYPVPVNHLGIHRTAFATSDIEADVATLKAQGVEFVSPITPCCSGSDSSGRIVAFYDPDGTIVELVEQPAMNWVLPVLLWFRDTFF